jgi:hypothetical protein
MKRHLTSRGRIRAGHLALGAVLFTQVGAAQTEAADKAAAEALFQQGIELMRVGKLTDACDRLERSSSIERGIGTSLYLAECYEKAGRTASAWGLFREAASEAQARGESERAIAGKRRADRLEPLLSRLTVEVAAGANVPGLEISRDGTPVKPGLWNVAIPVDPGDHRLQARAAGYADYSAVVKVDANGANVVTQIPALTPVSTGDVTSSIPVGAPLGSSPLLAPSVPPSSSAASSPGDSDAASSFGPQRTAGLVVGGVGLVALGVGTFFGVRAVSKNDSAKTYCPGGGAVCHDTAGTTLTEDAQSSARLANVFVTGGALLTAGGALLFLTAPTGHPDAVQRVGFSSDGRGARVTLGGAF